ncbi:hypothetical protein E2320_009580 [Naja naja]|nr:hypothetical protein E2320_009580 [Naja naja]
MACFYINQILLQIINVNYHDWGENWFSQVQECLVFNSQALWMNLGCCCFMFCKCVNQVNLKHNMPCYSPTTLTDYLTYFVQKIKIKL